jgi:hypothetical protein
MSLTKTRAASPAHSFRRDRRVRRLTAVVGVAIAMVTTSACGFWGLKESYRGYIAGPIAHGSITATEGATWMDGPGAAKGAFSFQIQSSVFNPSTKTGFVQLKGKVTTTGHDGVLSLTISNPRLNIAGTVGTLVADLTFRPFVGFNPPTLPPLQSKPGVSFGRVNLSGVSWVPNSNGEYAITNAPMTGIAAAMQLIGWDQFYTAPVALDPFSVNFKPT